MRAKAECRLTSEPDCGRQVDKLLETVADKHGQIDGVANCIGTVALTKPLHITDESEYRTVMDNNVLTAFNIVKGSVRFPHGSDVANGSVVAHQSLRFMRQGHRRTKAPALAARLKSVTSSETKLARTQAQSMARSDY